jgi:hypothetical protein
MIKVEYIKLIYKFVNTQTVQQNKTGLSQTQGIYNAMSINSLLLAYKRRNIKHTDPNIDNDLACMGLR